MNAQQLAQHIDHTALSAEKTEADIFALCEEARQHHFYSICINPCHIPLAKQALADSSVKICTVIGFPLGANATVVKAFETAQAIEAGAEEIDMVVNIGWVKSQQWEKVQEDIQAVFDICQAVPLKVILETCLLSEAEIVKLCEICKTIGVAFVKTSTGFNKAGATVEHVALMKRTVGEMGVKASGGIRDTQTTLDMIEAGASRIGASAGIAILEGLTAAK